ncbi:hypothetical protein NGB36_14775 [Streptomyces sp. RB6PN25]|uniref:Extensin n=1 Tax=Streptomyces humicola TaxID=2953240 RepID=A0ABT1PW10_9ACTN|nr:hypothetical protein [Streptomyces humicola]MCQ4081837.1 hypothetical protein [Streptomyces humicola]
MTSSPPSAREAAALLAALTRALAGVATLAAVFTAVNVTGFATAHHIPWPVAMLLDPMVALALSAVLLADARLASWGVPPPGWSAALRWFTGVTATVMNAWTSIWPDDRIGWPRHADPAGVLLHTVPPVLLILLTETVAAYRNRITTLLKDTADEPLRPGQHHPLPGPVLGSTRAGSTLPPGASPGPRPPSVAAYGGPHLPDTGPATAPAAPHDQPPPGHHAGGQVFAHALRLDTEHRSRTGYPMSIRQLKRTLRIGHARAKALRTQLDANPSRTAPTPHPRSAPAPGEHSRDCSWGHSQMPCDQGR